jgi:TrmH family RNA methyltransferase
MSKTRRGPIRVPSLRGTPYDDGMQEVISSTRNATVKSVARLKRAKERRATGQIVLEGPVMLAEALNAGLEPTLALATQDDAATRVAFSAIPSAHVLTVTRAVLESVADAAHPRSPVTVLPRPADGTLRMNDTVVLVGVSDPGNAGTIVRTAAAFGWDVAFTPDCVDMWAPKTLRAGAGAHFRTRLVPIELSAGADVLADHTVVATVVAGGEPNIAAPGPFALLVGSEPEGLAAEDVERADHALTIEMVDRAESLNVSIAAAIAMNMLR